MTTGKTPALIDRFIELDQQIDYLEREYADILKGRVLEWDKKGSLDNGQKQHTVIIFSETRSGGRRRTIATTTNKNFGVATKAVFREAELLLKKEMQTHGRVIGDTGTGLRKTG
jgi:hypothetical protein